MLAALSGLAPKEDPKSCVTIYEDGTKSKEGPCAEAAKAVVKGETEEGKCKAKQAFDADGNEIYSQTDKNGKKYLCKWE